MATLLLGSKLSSFLKLRKKKQQQQQLEDNQVKNDDKQNGGWEQVPGLVLDKIIQQLNLSDSLHISVVCKSWRLIIKQINIRNTQAPSLMLPLLKDSKYLTFFDLSESRFCNIKLPKTIQGSWCCGSSKGWLIMAKGYRSNPRIALFNPISGVQIPLPSLQTIPYFGGFDFYLRSPYNSAEFITKIELSSADAQHCVVAGIFQDNEILALCRPGDKGWTIFEEITMDESLDFFSDILFSKGILHVLISSLNQEYPFRFGVHKLRIGDGNQNEATLKVIPNRIFSEDRQVTFHLVDEFDDIWVGRNVPAYSYLVESEGEILIVQRITEAIHTDIDNILDKIDGEEDDIIDGEEDDIIDDEGDINNDLFAYFKTSKFEVYKIDNLGSNMSLRRLYSLGDHVLFVTPTSASVSTPATKLNGLKKNSIFFLDEHGYSDGNYDPIVCCESGVFYVGDGKIERCFPSMKNSSLYYRMNWF